MAQPTSASNTPYQIKFQYYRDAGPRQTVDLFLGNNPRSTYTPVCSFSYNDHPAGFIFHHCIVCGKERPNEFHSGHRRPPPQEGPMACTNPKCYEVIRDMQIGWGQDARRLFQAIWDRNIETLHSYRVDKRAVVLF